jgi:hypothetical protein
VVGLVKCCRQNEGDIGRTLVTRWNKTATQRPPPKSTRQNAGQNAGQKTCKNSLVDHVPEDLVRRHKALEHLADAGQILAKYWSNTGQILVKGLSPARRPLTSNNGLVK